jgi:hypothetical protein
MMTAICPELPDRSGLSAELKPRLESGSSLTAIKLPELSALELEKHVSVPEAAEIKGISPDTFKRHYPHLIRKQSPRRNTVKLRDLLSEHRARQDEQAGDGRWEVTATPAE